MHFWLSMLLAFLVSVTAIYLLKPIALKVGLVDHPDERKQHQGQVPLIGGIAFYLGILSGILTSPVSLLPYLSLITVMSILVLVGVLDDRHELTPKLRLLSQFLVGLIIIFWGKLELLSFGNLVGAHSIALGLFAIPVTLFAVMSIINAYNMMDGLDGLAGGISFIQIILLMALCYWHGTLADANFLAIIAMSILGFLIFNFPFKTQRAQVFMGDAGSMLLGAIMVWFAIHLTQGKTAILQPVSLLWIMLVPIFEIMAAVIRRLFKKQSPLAADRGHTHHRLIDQGLSNKAVTYLLCLATLIFGLVGIGMELFQVKESVMFLIFLGLFGLYFVWLTFSGSR